MKMEVVDPASTNVTNDEATLKNMSKIRAKKRKRESSGTMEDDVLPKNSLEVEKNLQTLAMRNNLDDASVKKILKKVVTNDHVLAFVKLREEEEEEEVVETGGNIKPITRAKAKELMKASPKSAPWNLELTPINHIPVKTRPEVKALIAQELPDDEDDEEYQPTRDEVQSDDDHATCSDIDSHPTTPSTPKSQAKSRSVVVTDGPFKVPQEALSQQEATIALRTRSKLSLSETPIEHIESSFIPPDDIPHPDVDDLWSDFLKECLNPVSNARNEDDDEADPEYNVAADPDAVEEDEESLEKSLIKISKKELNDLVTELFNVMPETQLTPNLNNEVVQQKGKEPPMQWEGKLAPISDGKDQLSSFQLERNETVSLSIDKMEPSNDQDDQKIPDIIVCSVEPITVDVREEQVEDLEIVEPPPALRDIVAAKNDKDTLEIFIENIVITNEQILILQQQLRMHIQIAASNFLQLFINPAHWQLAPKYKEYLEVLNSMADKQENSVVRVCNLKPALELIMSWEHSVSEDTPENKKIVNFMQVEVDKCRRRSLGNGVYVGDFPEEIKKVIANSSVFLYPYLLPSMPFRGVEIKRRCCYLPSEDHLIILGIDQFWSYVEDNPDLYRPPPVKNIRYRWGLGYTVDLICKYMLPWMSPKTLVVHISNVRKKHRDHPINKYFKTREIPPTKHVLIPFNAELTLYEQPESEIPKLWVRYLAKSSKRFRVHLQKKRPPTYQAPEGVEISSGMVKEAPKPPLPIHFTQDFPSNRINILPVKTKPDKIDVAISLNTDSCQKQEPVNEDPVIIMDTQHCSCCGLLRKISKYRQKRITEYVKRFKVKMECPCRSIRHPKISNRLRILLSYYKSNIKNVFSGLKCRIDAADKPTVHKFGIAKEAEDRVIEAKDREFVSLFAIRLSLRQNKVRNQQIKKSLFKILSRFDPDEGDPVKLMIDVYEACDVDLADMYNEFLGFLNPEQADRIDKFREYFINNCLEDLIRKTEEIVTDRNQKLKIFRYLSALSRKNPPSCVMCSALMGEMRDYPQLARYCFLLFPHRRIATSADMSKVDEFNSNPKQTSTNHKVEVANEKNVSEQVICRIFGEINQENVNPQNDVQNQEDHNHNDENVDERIIKIQELNVIEENVPGRDDQKMDTSDDVDGDTQQGILTIYKEQNAVDKCLSSGDQPNDEEIICSVELKEKCEESPCDVIKEEIVPKNEDMELDEDSLSDPIEESKVDWTRDEDKLILEVLQKQLSPEERLDKSIIEIIEDKKIPQIITETLSVKSLHVVRDRINYLLNILKLVS